MASFFADENNLKNERNSKMIFDKNFKNFRWKKSKISSFWININLFFKIRILFTNNEFLKININLYKFMINFTLTKVGFYINIMVMIL